MNLKSVPLWKRTSFLTLAILHFIIIFVDFCMVIRSTDRSLVMLPSQKSVASTTTPGPDASKAPPSLLKQETLQQRLKMLIEGVRERWTYAIFWQSYDYSGASCLRWGHGYYKGEEDKGKAKAPKTEEQNHRREVLRQLHALTSSSADDVDDEKVTDTMWFFMLSMTQSFSNASTLPGQAFFNSSPIWVTGPDRLSEFACQRARQGHAFGLQTLVSIPSANGVVELASTDVIFPNVDLMKKVLNFFIPNADSSPLRIKDVVDFVNPVDLPRLSVNQHQHHALRPPRKDNMLGKKEYIETENCKNDNLSKQSRGKEKISDSKCSWPLLSKSSDGGNGSTFSCSDNYSGPS